MSGTGIESGWYFKRRDDLSDAKGGPYSWDEMTGFAAQGLYAPHDLVWHATLPGWVPAHDVAGLYAPAAAPQPYAAPAPSPAAAPTQQPPTPRPPRRSRTGLVIALVAAAIVLVAAVGAGAWWFLAGPGGGSAGGGPKMGVAECVAPDPATLVETETWGEVPASQICVVLAEGQKPKVAEKIAKDLGGAVVGQLEFINLFQIQFPGTKEADLVAALDAAKATEGVEMAYPNEQSEERAEIWGVRVDPYDDSVYGAGAGDGYKAMGVPQAWNYIRGAGVKLEDVHVGIVDDGLYVRGEGAESEFGGKVKINYPDGEANGKLSGPRVSNGQADAAGSHGTGVATIIGGDPSNGGPSGVAGPLGDKLTISMTNHSSGNYGDATATPDPNDPTKMVWSDGRTYSLGSLVAITKQIEKGATVINCSWGADRCDPLDAAAYRRFFEKMAEKHPDVIFVCAAGNTNQTALDNRTSYPCGHPLPNMITVGAVDNDGQLASYSTIKGDHYVVDIAAPGTQAVVGLDANGGPVQEDGTSFASPEVAAAAAMLKSLDKRLTAAQIKEILLSSARTKLKNGDTEVAAPGDVGGKILAVDQAVLAVINKLREEKKLPPLKPEDLENLGVVDAVAVTGDPGEYAVKGIVKAVGQEGTKLSIEVTGEDHAIGGKTTQSLASAGEVKWDVSLPKDEGVITVRRLENDAASIITVERFDINGNWTGVFTITEFEITDQKAAEEEGCSAAILGALKGKKIPMTMDINVDANGQGSGTGLIDIGSLDPDDDVTSSPSQYGISYSGSTITYEPQDAEGVNSMTATVSRQGENLVQKGVLTGGGKGFRLKAVFTLSKPDTPK